VEGLRRADGDFANGGSKTVYTSGVSFRDELVVVLLHAGFTATITAKHKAGEVKAYHGRDGDRTMYTLAQAAGREHEFTPVRATVDGWAVHYAEADSNAGKMASRPMVQLQSAVKTVPNVGRVWCVSVQHQDSLIFAQRASADENGVVTKSSRPMVIGNCPIVDSVEGCTHVMRTDEYHDRNEQFAWVLHALALREPEIREFSRLNFSRTVLSKRKLQWFVDNKLVEGWADPRFPTVQGILRRGVTVEALREFVQGLGFGAGFSTMEWDKLWNTNMRVLDPIAHRYTALVRATKLNLVGDDMQQQSVQVNLHPKHPGIGTKTTTRSSTLLIEQDDARLLKEGEEFSLMNWGNAIVTALHWDGPNVTHVDARLYLEGNVKKTEKKLTWLDAHDSAAAALIPLTLVELDHLLTVPRVEDGVDMATVLNPTTWIATKGVLGEPAMSSLKQGQHIQVMRRGFFICDQIATADRPMQLIFIPDGRASDKMASLAAPKQ